MIQNSKGKEKVVNNTIINSSIENNNIGKKGMNYWILETGATNHMACSIFAFINYYKIKPVRVKLPNNQNVTVIFVGTVFLTKDIILHDFLYILDFMLNIIFVQRLMKSLKCQIVFTHDVC